jgi:Putative MetA-pathway of phenol degradation
VLRSFVVLMAVVATWTALVRAAAYGQDDILAREPEATGLPELETDRDAFTPATSTAGSNTWIVEWSYSFIDNRVAPDTHSFPELLARYGLGERVELRIGTNYEVGGGGNVVSSVESAEGIAGGGLSYEARMLYGVKVGMSEQDGWVPRSCAILEGFTPTSGEGTATQVVATYAAGWEVWERWRFESSLRYATGNEALDAFNRWGPSVILRLALTEEWHAHLEYFGIFSQGAIDNTSRAFVSPGVHYNFTPNFELGLRLGWGVTEDAANFFVNTGFGWRF